MFRMVYTAPFTKINCELHYILLLWSYLTSCSRLYGVPVFTAAVLVLVIGFEGASITYLSLILSLDISPSGHGDSLLSTMDSNSRCVSSG